MQEQEEFKPNLKHARIFIVAAGEIIRGLNTIFWRGSRIVGMYHGRIVVHSQLTELMRSWGKNERLPEHELFSKLHLARERLFKRLKVDEISYKRNDLKEFFDRFTSKYHQIKEYLPDYPAWYIFGELAERVTEQIAYTKIQETMGIDVLSCHHGGGRE